MNVPDTDKRKYSCANEESPSVRVRRTLSLLLCVAACSLFPLSTLLKAVTRTLAPEPAGQLERFALTAAARPDAAQDFSTFSHATPRHAALACASCHRRETNSPRPELPGHKACTDCHVQQFVTAESGMCMICHTNLESGSPPVKSFPALKSFNARFDHAQHTSGAARPTAGCVACHTPARRGVAFSIVTGLDAHANCYQCHTPGAQSGGRDISSCDACHAPGRYARTPTNARAFAINFSHAAHSQRVGLNCADCHTVKAGLPQSRQVASPLPAQHFAPARARSCAACHDNRRAFGGDDFSDCKRCHRGATFRFQQPIIQKQKV
ncbi:MAG: cytochrome c3 family protein [Acidobacteria bacterium]|nr:cytochrome c3 family protein [Acidobacteriota bacterium]